MKNWNVCYQNQISRYNAGYLSIIHLLPQRRGHQMNVLYSTLLMNMHVYM